MKIRKISALLVCVMILAAFSGCGKKDKETDPVKKDYSDFVTLGEYKGIEYVPQVSEVTDEDIQYEIDYLVHQNTIENPIYEGLATMGDTVNIDYVGYVDGVAFDGGDTQGAGTNLTLGSGSYIDDFEDQVAGHSPGDAFEVNVTFPDDYGNEELNGKDAVFETTLNYIVETVTPEYDDALVATATDYATTEEFEAAKRSEYEANYEESDLEANKGNVFSIVLDNCTVTSYPEKDVEAKIQEVMDNGQETAEANGVDFETYLSYYGYDVDSFKEYVQTSVEDYFKQLMVMKTIAKAEGIEVTDEEVEAKKQEILELTGLSTIDEVNEMYGYKESDYYFEVLFNKIRDFLYENAVPVDSTATDATETEDAAPVEDTTEE